MALIPFRRKKQSKMDANLEEESNLFTKLCDELRTEILLRLPSTSAIRFKVVCKRWFSLISSPYFIANLRHNKNAQSSLVFQIINNCDGTCESGGCNEFHSDFQIISINPFLDPEFRLSCLPSFPVELDKVNLEGSFADLILCSCITQTNKFNYYVSNLLTRQWVALPPASADNGFGENHVVVGFLCVPYFRPDKFVVVRLHINTLFLVRVQVFSSKDCQWRTLVVSSPRTLNSQYFLTYFVAYRGMLHWQNADCIVVYDPLNTPETFSRIIDLPIQLPISEKFRRTCCLGVCQNRLRVVKVTGEDTKDVVVNVWELKDYGSGAWNLVHKVYIKNKIYIRLPKFEKRLRSTSQYFSVLSLHPKNENIVYLKVGNGVVSFNMKLRMVECYYPVKKNSPVGRVNVFHVSNQWWPTSVSSLLH